MYPGALIIVHVRTGAVHQLPLLGAAEFRSTSRALWLAFTILPPTLAVTRSDLRATQMVIQTSPILETKARDALFNACHRKQTAAARRNILHIVL